MTDRAHLLDAHTAALAIGVSPATLRDWTRRGLLTRHGSPRAALYDWRELEQARNAAKPRRADRCA